MGKMETAGDILSSLAQDWSATAWRNKMREKSSSYQYFKALEKQIKNSLFRLMSPTVYQSSIDFITKPE